MCAFDLLKNGRVGADQGGRQQGLEPIRDSRQGSMNDNRAKAFAARFVSTWAMLCQLARRRRSCRRI